MEQGPNYLPAPRKPADGEVSSVEDRRWGGLRVLIAEDNLVNQRMAALMLQRLGVSYELVDNGAAAVERVGEAAFDLILMDVQMPVMGGLEATRLIRSNVGAKQPKIPAVTAGALLEERQACLDAGMDACLLKPFKLTDLELAIGLCFAPSSRRVRSSRA